MSRPSRNLPSLDYKELDHPGRQVYKARDKQRKMEDHRTAAIKIGSDVEDLFYSYDLEEITKEDGLEGYVGEVKVLKQEYIVGFMLSSRLLKVKNLPICTLIMMRLRKS